MTAESLFSLLVVEPVIDCRTQKSERVISDSGDKQQLNTIKSPGAHLSLEPDLQLQKRSSGRAT